MPLQDTDLLLVGRDGSNFKVTAAEFEEYTKGSGEADTPLILSPLSGQGNVSGLSSATSSSFVGRGNLIHTSSSWQIVRVSDGAVIKDETSAVFLQSYSFASSSFLSPVSFLDPSTEYQVRVKYNYTGGSFGSTAWSAWVKFTTSSSWPGPGPYPAPSGYTKISDWTIPAALYGLSNIVFNPYNGYYYAAYGKGYDSFPVRSMDLRNWEYCGDVISSQQYGRKGTQLLPWGIMMPYSFHIGQSVAPSSGSYYWNSTYSQRVPYSNGSVVSPDVLLLGYVSTDVQSTLGGVPGPSTWAANLATGEAMWAPNCYNLSLYKASNPTVAASTVIAGSSSGSGTLLSVKGTCAVGYNPTIDISCYQSADARPNATLSSVNYRSLSYRQGWATPTSTEIGTFNPGGRAFSPNCMTGDGGDIYAYATVLGSTGTFNFQVQKFAGATGDGFFKSLPSGTQVVPGGFLYCPGTVGGRPIFYTANQAFTTVNWPSAPAGVSFGGCDYTNNTLIIYGSDGIYIPNP